MRRTPTLAVDGRRRDGGPVRDQASQRWFIGLTPTRVGSYVDVDCYTFQSAVLVSQNSVVFVSLQLHISAIADYSHLNV